MKLVLHPSVHLCIFSNSFPFVYIIKRLKGPQWEKRVSLVSMPPATNHLLWYGQAGLHELPTPVSPQGRWYSPASVEGLTNGVASECDRQAPHWTFLSNEANWALVLAWIVSPPFCRWNNWPLRRPESKAGRQGGAKSWVSKTFSHFPFLTIMRFPAGYKKQNYGHSLSFRSSIILELPKMIKIQFFHQEKDYWHLLRFSKVLPGAPGRSCCLIFYLFEFHS